MNKKLKLVVLVYLVFVLSHSIDFFPLWYWNWYYDIIGGWIAKHPVFWFMNILMAGFMLAIWSGSYRTQPTE